MDTLINFYAAGKYNPFILLGIIWIFWPGLMFIVAAIFESRKVYLGEGQSWLFFPGDFLLGVIIVAFVGMHARSPVGWPAVYGKDYWQITGIITFILATIGRYIDTRRYEPKSRISPTKLVHDYCGYFLCSWAIIGYGGPQLVWTIIHPETFDVNYTLWCIAIPALITFGLLGVHDLRNMPTPEQLLLRHPAEYKPIWKK